MGTKEWAWKNANCIQGCGLCIYCYAKAMAKRRGISEDDWSIRIIRETEVEKGRGRVRNKSNSPWDYMYPTTHNIFSAEPYFSASMKLLKKLLLPGNSVLITLKPELKVVKYICENFNKFIDKIGFRFTITSVDQKVLDVFEPFAPPLTERIESLEYANECTYPVTVSSEPGLDPNPHKLIKLVKPYLSKIDTEKDIGTIWWGFLKLKYIPAQLRKGKVQEYLELIKDYNKFEYAYKYYEKLYDNPLIRWKESISKLMIQNNIKVKRIIT